MADYKTELEDLTGKLLNGDITPVVADLLRATPYKDELLRYLGCEVNKVPDNKVNVTVEPDSAPTFDELFSTGTIVTRR